MRLLIALPVALAMLALSAGLAPDGNVAEASKPPLQASILESGTVLAPSGPLSMSRQNGERGYPLVWPVDSLPFTLMLGGLSIIILLGFLVLGRVVIHRLQQAYVAHTAAEKETSAIDRAAFDSLWKILGDDAQELTRSYLDETVELLENMRESLEQRDWEGLDRSAHTLKGSSVTIGAKGLAEICQQLQIIVESKEPGQTVEKLMELEDGFDKVKRELGNLLV